jgi:hypothetical protein
MFSKEYRFFDESFIKATNHLYRTNAVDFEKV